VAWEIDSDGQRKAYPDDQFAYGDCRQLTDFMGRLGLKFPLDEEENPVGTIFWFELR
jgi:hypothetical protein